ncbi:hypothetical protein fugu_000988 [Takifugu bimaculatus]|uniref:alpha-1,6-mannosyl-glycoprotein 6-beta-N-acetylglucosaminyltransferase n=1 Tax=Takifugu bimaculatus TaxID=433685 RepID=A0A4Z2CI94_9TELE|nr:hypothetical protein fugu_000988 [Takifugu bimaculatus]
MRVALRPRSGCLLLCLCLSVLTMLLQNLWMPLDITRDDATGRSPQEQGQRGHTFHRLAVRLEALSTQVQRLSRERDKSQLTGNHLSLLLQGFRRNQQGLAQLVEKELKKVSQQLDTLSRLHHPGSHMLSPLDALNLRTASTGPDENCEVPVDPAYPLCAQKVEFLQAHWQSDPCYAFYGVNGTACSILTYLSKIEDFCPPPHGSSHSSLPWHQKPLSSTGKSGEDVCSVDPSRAEDEAKGQQCGLQPDEGMKFRNDIKKVLPTGNVFHSGPVGAAVSRGSGRDRRATF